jgi:hypothetical protein
VQTVLRRRTGLVVLAVASVLLLFLYLYRPPATGGVTEQMVEASLNALGYEYCGTYTSRPGNWDVTFSKTFYGDVRCFIIMKRPGDGYMFKNPVANIVIEPPTEKTVYRYSAGIRFFFPLQVASLDESIRPFIKWNAGILNRTAVPPPRANGTAAANDDIYVFFSYRPDTDGFPVKVTLMVRADIVEGRAPPLPSLLEAGIKRLAEQLDAILSGRLADTSKPQPEKNKLAAQLGIKDVKAFMSYLGYELCGEFTAKDVKEVQKIEIEVKIDPNKGKPCYILIHPPPGRNAFMIIHSEFRTSATGDMDQFREYMMKLDAIGLRGKEFFTTPYVLRSAFEALGLGRVGSSSDVEKPYSERSGLGGSYLKNTIVFFDNAPILIYFAYKGDTAAYGEPLRFELITHTVVEFYIVPAKEVVVVD